MSVPSDQRALQASQAGLRLIAMLTFYNNARFDRLRVYLREHFSAAALEEQPAAARLAQFKVLAAQHGRLRVRQVAAADKHRAVALLESQQGGLLLADMACEDEYPHRVSAFDLVPVPEEAPDDLADG